MSRSVMTITKWVPLELEEHKTIFNECKALRKSSICFDQKICSFLNGFKSRNFSRVFLEGCDEVLIQNLEMIVEEGVLIKDDFFKVFGKLTMEKPSNLSHFKMIYWKDVLWTYKMRICYLLLHCIIGFIHLFIYFGEQILTLTLKLSNIHNQLLHLDTKYNLFKSTPIYNNSCPYLMYPMKKLSITKILQVIAQNRAELCCHKLMDCLLETYKLFDNREDEETGSDTSSVEIYRALTRHMSPPHKNTSNDSKSSERELHEKNAFSNMNELIRCEEKNILDLLSMAVKVSPGILGNDAIKKLKTGEVKVSTKAKNKVLDYYHQVLWGEVGIFLEHVVLWWGNVPLSSRPPHSSQHLREWINQFLPTADVPQFILSALSCLSDGLGVHITSTSWDQRFRKVLVASKVPITQETGGYFVDLLQDLVTLCNQCEVTNEWIIGAPLDELPLVEQIPVLHRLDHSVHTTRLWAISEAKRLSNLWNVECFFLITDNDVIQCLLQLNDLRLADHSLEIDGKIKLGEHVQVCATMREKLVSEVKANIEKLKEATAQCVDCLACACRTISLANLQMIFPAGNFWRIGSSDYYSNKPLGYVAQFLERVLTPVLTSTEDHQIGNMILKIMCESWLDHIYVNKIKFSQCGAIQLLTDFASVSTWIINCSIISQEMRRRMLKNEVLRRCEGVGKLLLRSPGEHIKMSDKTKKIEVEDETSSNKSGKTEMMPAEMYVPNQEQWLELRATRRSVFITTLCCSEINPL
nr:uncharacterized protein LOC111427337 [Onthophagus taurus]